MFEADNYEREANWCQLLKYLTSPLKQSLDMLAYLYMGTAPDVNSELIEVADKYQLRRLVRICENGLRNSIMMLSKHSFWQTYVHGRTALKKACFQFICLSSAKVFQTSEWANFKERKDHASLFVEVQKMSCHSDLWIPNLC